MLTPAQVKNHPFAAGARGTYKSADVDAYLAEVASSYEQMFKENGELIRKIGLLADKVEEYRNDEDNIRAALLTAQRMADKIVREAKESVSGQLSDAQTNAERMVADATARSNAMLQEAQGKAETLTTDAAAKAGKLVADAEAKAASVTQEAERKAQEIVFEANRQAEEQLSAVKRSVVHESLVLEMAKKEVSDFRSQLMSAYKEHIELINRLPALAREQQQAEEAAKQPEQPQEAPAAKTDEIEQEKPPAEEPAPAVDVPAAESVAQAQSEEAAAPPAAEEPAAREEEPEPLAQTQEIDLPKEPEPQGQRKGGFRVRFDELDNPVEPVEPPQSDSSLKFGPDYDIFNDEDDEDEDEATNMAFRGFFKRK